MSDPPQLPRHSVIWFSRRLPLLLIRLCPGVNAVRELPGDLDPDVLAALADSAFRACGERLEVVLVLPTCRAVYFNPDGTVIEDVLPPSPEEQVEFRPRALKFLPGPGAFSG